MIARVKGLKSISFRGELVNDSVLQVKTIYIHLYHKKSKNMIGDLCSSTDKRLNDARIVICGELSL